MKILFASLAFISIAGAAHANEAIANGSINGQMYGTSSGSVVNFSAMPGFSDAGTVQSAQNSANYQWSVGPTSAEAVSSSNAFGQAHAYAFAQVGPERVLFDPTPPVPEAPAYVFIAAGLLGSGLLVRRKKELSS